MKDDENILVIVENLKKSYLMTGDGTSTPAIIKQPENEDSKRYTYLSQSAVVKDLLYIFGGSNDNHSRRVRLMLVENFINYF